MQIIETRTRHLPVALTQEELRTVSLEFADTFHELNAEEQTQKNVKDQMKAKLSELNAKLTRLSSVVRNGMEYRAVEVEYRLTDLGFVQEARLDTGEILASRPPTDSERQLALKPETEPGVTFTL